MKQSAALAHRFREVMLNGTWIANTNYKDQLDQLDWKIATRPFQQLNTISILAQHIHYYIHGILGVFIVGKLDISDQYSFDFPLIESMEQWKSFLNRLWKDSESLAQHIEGMPDGKLMDKFVDEKYGNYLRNINGMIEHCYYHLGQIVYIRKAMQNQAENDAC